MNRRSHPTVPVRRVPALALLVALAALIQAPPCAAGDNGLDFERLAAIREVGDVRISPDGGIVAYTLEVPRKIGDDDDGPEWVELWVVGTDGSPPRPYVHGKVNVSAVRFTPDGRLITYLAKRGDDDKRSLWAIPVDGGESKRLLGFDSDIRTYRWSPDGTRLAFVAAEPESEARKEAKDKGYTQEVFEEDWRQRKVWIARPEPFHEEPTDPSTAEDPSEAAEPRALPVEGAVFAVEWTPDGKKVVLTVAPRPLIDEQYMLRRIRVHDVGSGEQLAAIDNPGKLGALAVSPDGSHVAMITAADPNDPRDGRLAVAPIDGGAPRDLMPGLEGHVTAMAWRDGATLAFVADVGEETRFGRVGTESGEVQERLLSGVEIDGTRSPVLTALALSADGDRAVFVGETPSHPGEVYSLGEAEAVPRRLTDSNPWLSEVALARQQVVGWTARDGLELHGVLVRPLGEAGGEAAPLIMIVHGGPEGHVRNGWITSYSRPGQVAAAGGYAVFYPNYRGSTGRGVAFSKLGQGDAAGREFDDLIDAVDHLVSSGIVDRDRVGITGGSYGGYATAWCATRFSERFRAGVMFVGISNKISKGLTTEIPIEDEMVHTRFDPWTRWQFSLERSPIYYAEQSRTALLIAGGTADTRVHPSQSLQLYRALKLIGKAPVRYVRYPGEGHGNRRAAARDDYARRLMRWMDHFLLGATTELPPWELDLPDETEETEDEG